MKKLYRDGAYKGNLAQSVADVKSIAEQLKKKNRFAFDTETTHKLWIKASLVGISISLGKRATTWYIPTGHVADEYYEQLRIQGALEDPIFEDIEVQQQIRIDKVVDLLKPIFEDTTKELNVHNGKYDFHILSKYGFWDYRNNKRIMKMKNYDTMMGMFLINENTPNGLKDGCKQYGIIDDMKEFNVIVATVPNSIKKACGIKASQKATMDMVHTEVSGAYACDDAYGSYKLRDFVDEDLKKEGMWERFNQVEMPFMKVLYLKEQRGMKIDVNKMKLMGEQMEKDLEQLAYDIYEEVGHEFNMNAPAQLGKVLFDELGFPVLEKTKTGQPSCGKETVEKLLEREYKGKKMQKAQKVLKMIDSWRKLSKHKGSFVDGILELVDKNNKVHPQFKQHGTVTGRLSCTDPNCQQMPRPLDPNDKNPDIRAKYDIRACFIADDENKRVIASDYSNLELRIIAHFSEEPSFVQAFFNGEDIHSRTAVEMLNLSMKPNEVKKKDPESRQIGKTINFAIPYGTTAPTLAGQIGNGCTTEEAQEKLDDYFKKFKYISKFIKDTKKLARKQGYVETILGKKRRVEDDIRDRRFWIQESAERQAVNSVIQGSAADIIKVAQIKIETDVFLNKWGVTMRMQIHDELVFNCPKQHVKKAMQRISYIMGHPFGRNDGDNLSVPLNADPDSGLSWSEAK